MYQKIRPGVYRPINPKDVKTMAEAMNIISALCAPAVQAEVVKVARDIPRPPKAKKNRPSHHIHFRGVGESVLRYQRKA